MVSLSLGLFTGYLFGSVPTGYLIGKAVKGIDIRQYGSGNVGATNVFRVVGWKWGLFVLFVDAAKGWLAVFLLPSVFSSGFAEERLSTLTFGVAAIAGHTWTIWLRFRGGKGVATSAGVFLALVPQAAGAALLLWVIVFASSRIVSLASLTTAASFPFWIFVFYKDSADLSVLLPLSGFIAVFIFLTHRENLKRLFEGKEKRLF